MEDPGQMHIEFDLIQGSRDDVLGGRRGRR